jgi:hypothetical protein
MVHTANGVRIDGAPDGQISHAAGMGTFSMEQGPRLSSSDSSLQKPLRQNSNFFNQINLIWAVQSLPKKYFCFSETKSLLYSPPSRPTEGRIRIVRDAGRDAVDAAASGAPVIAGRVSRER